MALCCSPPDRLGSIERGKQATFRYDVTDIGDPYFAAVNFCHRDVQRGELVWG